MNHPGPWGHACGEGSSDHTSLQRGRNSRLAAASIGRPIDCSTIDPFHFTYPFDNLWNAYSPFRKYGPVEIETLDEIKGLEVTE
jgi:hypothetical protein